MEQRGVSDERLPLHSTLTFPCLYSAAVRPVLYANKGFPGGSGGEESACNAGALALIPGLGRSSVKGHGSPSQYSCLENSIDWEAWRATAHGVTESDTDWATNTFTFYANRNRHRSIPFTVLVILPLWGHALQETIRALCAGEFIYAGFRASAQEFMETICDVSLKITWVNSPVPFQILACSINRFWKCKQKGNSGEDPGNLPVHPSCFV